MKKLICFIYLIPGLFLAQSPSKKITALFIGNSYTYVNNLPQLVEQLALANGDTLVYDSYAPGGYTFNNHFNDVNTHTKIYSQNWDYVILQAQSQEPSFSPAQVNGQTLPYALKLDSLIKDNYACSKTVFYETWGRKFGDASNCAFYPPICTYTGMQNRLKQSYKLFADQTSGVLAPAGEAFRESIAQNPNLELYQADQSHPSLEGSYLAAAVFYETLFQKSVVTNTFNSTVSTATATLLRQIANTVVRDSLNVWNLGVHLPWADFTFTNLSPVTIQCQSNSPNLNNFWTFGDGLTSNLVHPSHTYTSSGLYQIKHIVSNTCKADSAQLNVQVSVPVGLTENNKLRELYVYPNPCVDFVYLNSKHESKISIYTLSGQLIREVPASIQIDVSDLENGLYILQTESKGITSRACLIKMSQ